VKLLSVLKTTLLNEVSEKVKKQLVSKWGTSTEDTPETMISYIDSFETIKSGLPADKRDIMKYSYDDLKNIIKSRLSSKIMSDIFTEFKKKESKIENTALKNYIKRFLEIESLLPASKKNITNYKFLELVKMVDDVYPKLISKKLSEKFMKENPELTQDQVLFYIGSYFEILDEIPSDSKRVDDMTFVEFEHLIDGISGEKKSTQNKSKDLSDIAMKYDENNLKIFAPKTKDQCIKLRNGRSWCTSREGGGNMYYNYRLGNERTLYYVIDEDKGFDDLNFACVVLVDPNGGMSLADGSNSGTYSGHSNVPWNDIVKKLPKLANLKSIFKPEPLTVQEKELINVVKNARVGDNPMESFKSPQEVEMWLEYNSPRLTDIQFSNLDINLKKKYIALGMDLTSSMIQNSEPEVIKYYVSKKIDSIKTTNIKNLTSTEIALLNTPILKKLKEELKSKFAGEMGSGTSGNKIEIEYPNGPSAKFAALYGFGNLFESLPNNITNFLFNNKSDDNINLSVPSSISRFKNLEALLLMKCVSELPEEIGSLQNLTFLALPNNPNLKKLPKSILLLKNVKFINLQSTNPEFPEGFENFYKEEIPGSGFYARKPGV